MESLRRKPTTGGVTVANDRLSFRVIDDGLWSAFLERHLVNAIQLEYWCLAGMYGLPEQAVEYAGRARQAFWGLGLSGSKRLVDEFSLESSPGAGTTVIFVKWAPF